METERLTRSRDGRVLRIIMGVLSGDFLVVSTRESNEPYLPVYVKEFQGAIWAFDEILAPCCQHHHGIVTIRQF